jgi:DNA polymerase III delta prime subunit
MRDLWVEKYRPNTTQGYVFRDQAQKDQVQEWIDSGAIPHLLFSGVQGAGKTTLAKLLINELDTHDFDVKMINASSNNGVDYIRDSVEAFATVMPYGDFKYIILDEADYLSPNAQAALRGVMEKYSNSLRFILTCNYPQKIIPAIHSRCQGFHIANLDKTEYTARIAEILITEAVDFELEVLDIYVKTTYPDMRKCINLCQQNVKGGKLMSPNIDDGASESDYQLMMVALFKEKKFKEARDLICKQVSADEYEDMFRFMYKNLEFWADGDENKEDQCILVIRNGLVKAISCADAEINLSATMIELEIIANG